MGKKFRSIKENNLAWLKKKVKYEPMPKYAGMPEILIRRASIPFIKENSTEANKTRN